MLLFRLQYETTLFQRASGNLRNKQQRIANKLLIYRTLLHFKVNNFSRQLCSPSKNRTEYLTKGRVLMTSDTADASSATHAGVVSSKTLAIA